MRVLVMIIKSCQFDTLCNLGYQQELQNTFTSPTFIKDNLGNVFAPFGTITPSVALDDIDDKDNVSGTIEHAIGLKNLELTGRAPYQVIMRLMLRQHGELSAPIREAESYPWFISASFAHDGENVALPLIFPMLTLMQQGVPAYQALSSSQIKQLLQQNLL